MRWTLRRSQALLVTAALAVACADSPVTDAGTAGAPPARPVDVEAASGKAERSRSAWRDGGTVVSTRERTLRVYRRPDASSRSTSVLAANPIDQRLRFLVIGDRDSAGQRWLRVLVPERPNGNSGWVRRRGLTVRRVAHSITVDLSRYRLRHFENGRLVDEFKVGIGQEQYPTPLGTFYVWARVPQPSEYGPYGRFALGLSGFSPVLSDWPGGGRSAIHGTANPADRGAKVSHGCVRVFNHDMKRLEGVPMGTPVVIRA